MGKVRTLETAGNLFSSAAERVANQKWTVKKEWSCSDSEKSPKDSNLFLPSLWNSYLELSKSLESLLLQVTDIIFLPLAFATTAGAIRSLAWIILMGYKCLPGFCVALVNHLSLLNDFDINIFIFISLL